MTAAHLTAQTSAPSAAQTRLNSDNEFQERINVAAALSIARIAQLDLRTTGGPQLRDFNIAGDLLDIAHELAPTDAELLRLLIEARSNSGDSGRVDDLCRVLLRLDPADTVTQLRVISSAISNRQNVDERLALYDKFLGKAGETLDSAVRSRLAVDSALLSRDNGDIDAFARKILLASQLDSTNKEAAVLALGYFLERRDDPEGRIELIINVLKADPFDADVHLALARELSKNQAYKAAQRFYILSQRLHQVRGVQIPNDLANEGQVGDWILNGAENFIKILNEQVQQQRDKILEVRAELLKSGTDPSLLPDIKETHLSIDGERLRVLAASALGKPELLEPAVREMLETVDRSVANLNDPDKRSHDINDATAKTLIDSIRLESVWLRLWADRDLDQAAKLFDELRAAGSVEAADIPQIEAWIKLRRGQYEEALSALTNLGDQPLAKVGLALVAEGQSDFESAIRQYIAIINRVPGSPAGAFALTRADTLIAQTGSKQVIQPPPSTAKISQLADSVPQWLESMIANPLEFITINAQLDAGPDGLVGMFDRLKVHLKIRNVSRIPLGIGPEAPINSRLLLVPSVRIASKSTWREGMLSVVSLERRLRLLPREEMDLDIWPDNGIVGRLFEQNLSQPISCRWRALQGFELIDGLYEAGPLCLSADFGPAVRPTRTIVLATPDEIAARITFGSALEVAEAALAWRDRTLAAPLPERMPPEPSKAILDTLIARFPKLDRAGKILILATMPRTKWMQPMSAIDDLALADTDDAVVRVALATRIADPADPRMADEHWTNRPGVLDFARALRQRLADNVRTFARPRLDHDPEDFDDPLDTGPDISAAPGLSDAPIRATP